MTEHERLARLATCEAAIARDDLEAALAAALDVWRATRARCVGEAIDVLDARARARHEQPKPRKNDAAQAAWMAAIETAGPLEHGWLAHHVFSNLSGSTTEARARLEQRVAAILRLPPDPRYATWALEAKERWYHRFELVEHAGDERATELWTAMAHDRPHLYKFVERLPPVTPLAGAERDRWIAISGAPTPEKLDEQDTLFAAVHAAPHDDAPRLVLADQLQELRDPRGDLIALQLAEQTPERQVRIRALLKEHGRTWCGRLAHLADRVRFQRGFPAGLELGGSWRADDWDRYLEDPVWSTIEDIGGRLKPAMFAHVLGRAGLRALRALSVDADEIMDVIEVRQFALTELRAERWKGGAARYVPRIRSRVIPLLEATPSITHLAIREDAVPLILEAPAARRLTSLRVAARPERAAAIWPLLPATIAKLSIDTLEVRRTPTGTVVSTGFYRGDAIPGVARAAEAALVELVVLDTLHSHRDELAAQLAVPLVVRPPPLHEYDTVRC